MLRPLRILALASAAATALGGPASAYFIDCGPGRASLFHMSQYGAFYAKPDGSLYYQYFNDMFDKKSVDPRCTRLLGGDIPLNRQPAGF